MQRFLNMAPKTSSGYPVPKSTAPPLEPHRALAADPSDPRTGCIWPCQGSHSNVKTGSNGSGTWQDCQVCALRVSYTPRQGTPAKHAAHVDPTVVMAALNKLETDLPNGQMPTADLVRMVIKLILSQKGLEARGPADQGGRHHREGEFDVRALPTDADQPRDPTDPIQCAAQQGREFGGPPDCGGVGLSEDHGGGTCPDISIVAGHGCGVDSGPNRSDGSQGIPAASSLSMSPAAHDVHNDLRLNPIRRWLPSLQSPLQCVLMQ